MDLSVVRPSADAVSAACCRCNLWLVAFIKVTLVYCDCQSFVIVVVFSVVYIALIEGECCDRGFVIHFDTDFFRCCIVGGPVICGNFHTNIVGVEVIRVDGYMSGPALQVGCSLQVCQCSGFYITCGSVCDCVGNCLQSCICIVYNRIGNADVKSRIIGSAVYTFAPSRIGRSDLHYRCHIINDDSVSTDVLDISCFICDLFIYNQVLACCQADLAAVTGPSGSCFQFASCQYFCRDQILSSFHTCSLIITCHRSSYTVLTKVSKCNCTQELVPCLRSRSVHQIFYCYSTFRFYTVKGNCLFDSFIDRVTSQIGVVISEIIVGIYTDSRQRQFIYKTVVFCADISFVGPFFADRCVIICNFHCFSFAVYCCVSNICIVCIECIFCIVFSEVSLCDHCCYSYISYFFICISTSPGRIQNKACSVRTICSISNLHLRSYCVDHEGEFFVFPFISGCIGYFGLYGIFTVFVEYDSESIYGTVFCICKIINRIHGDLFDTQSILLRIQFFQCVNGSVQCYFQFI